jgi:hypothetical protein
MRENLLDGWKILGEFREDIRDERLGDDETFWYVCETPRGEVLIMQGGCPTNPRDLGDLKGEDGRAATLRHGGTWYANDDPSERELCAECRKNGAVLKATGRWTNPEDEEIGPGMCPGVPLCEDCYDEAADAAAERAGETAGGDDPDEMDMADAANSRLDDERDL